MKISIAKRFDHSENPVDELNLVYELGKVTTAADIRFRKDEC